MFVEADGTGCYDRRVSNGDIDELTVDLARARRSLAPHKDTTTAAVQHRMFRLLRSFLGGVVLWFRHKLEFFIDLPAALGEGCGEVGRFVVELPKKLWFYLKLAPSSLSRLAGRRS